MFEVTPQHLAMVAKNPHLIGHLVGKNKLTRMHTEWILDAWKALDHSAMQAHRGAYKTTALTEVGPIWWLLFHPNDRIGIIRKTFTDASSILKTIAKYMDTEQLQAVFYAAHQLIPKPITRKDSSLVFNFKQSVTKEGSIDAHGLDGSLTGFHYDKIILDDIVTLKDRLSKAEREKTKEASREILTNIIDPGKQVIHVGTPWHKDDAWQLFNEPKKYTCYETGILTQEEINAKRALTTPILFAANYELRHTSSDDLIFGEVAGVEPWDHSKFIRKIHAHVDAKFSGSHYGAVTLMAERMDGKIQAKGWVFKEHVEEKVKWIREICHQHNVRSLFIESNPDKGYTAKLLRNPTPNESAKITLNVEEYSESTNKHIKIISHLLGRWRDIIWDIDTQEAYLEQVMDYREGQEPDDAPDSAASLIRAAFPAPRKATNGLYEL
jgi:hypothetical protein